MRWGLVGPFDLPRVVFVLVIPFFPEFFAAADIVALLFLRECEAL